MITAKFCAILILAAFGILFLVWGDKDHTLAKKLTGDVKYYTTQKGNVFYISSAVCIFLALGLTIYLIIEGARL